MYIHDMMRNLVVVQVEVTLVLFVICTAANIFPIFNPDDIGFYLFPNPE